ncbi:MAG: hypothetical protein VZQ61_06975 [Christensenellaceae bacterium]
MKKILITILVLVLIGAGVGAFFWGRSLSDRDADKGTAKSNTTYRVDYLQDSYVKGSLIIFAVTATSDVKYTSMSYSLNNGEQTLFVVKTGESKDLENKIGKGKYYIKSDATTIATNNLNTGWYTLEIKATDADGSEYVLTEKPILIRITAAAATTNTDAAA